MPLLVFREGSTNYFCFVGAPLPFLKGKDQLTLTGNTNKGIKSLSIITILLSVFWHETFLVSTAGIAVSYYFFRCHIIGGFPAP
jgi:hypothetical protein